MTSLVKFHKLTAVTVVLTKLHCLAKHGPYNVYMHIRRQCTHCVEVCIRHVVLAALLEIGNTIGCSGAAESCMVVFRKTASSLRLSGMCTAPSVTATMAVCSLSVQPCCFVLQVSNDVRMVLPLLVAIIMAKWVADAVSHSLYHSILEVKCVPILHSDPQSRVSLDLIPVHYVMACPVITFQERMPLNQIRETLRDTRHNGFPVVRNTPQGQVFVGLVVRDHLMVLLRRALARGTTANLDVTYEDLNHQFVTAAARHLIWEQHMAVLQVSCTAAKLQANMSFVVFWPLLI